jgi:adenosine deaminase
MDIQTFLQKLPKVELHLHLEGALNPSTFAELAVKHGKTLPPYEDPRELYRFEPTSLPGDVLEPYGTPSHRARAERPDCGNL